MRWIECPVRLIVFRESIKNATAINIPSKYYDWSSAEFYDDGIDNGQAVGIATLNF